MFKHAAIIISLIFASATYADEPSREKGISVYALPQRVATIANKPWGFEVKYAPYLKEESGIPYLQTAEQVLAYIKKQSPDVIQNGLWVVTTNPSAYSAEELALQEQVKKVLPQKSIPLFWARGSELNKGFTRY